MTSDAQGAAGRIRALLIVAAVLGALLLLVPHLSTYHVRVIDTVLIYVLLGVGLNMVVGYAGLLDLGYVAFYAIGAYSSRRAFKRLLREFFAARRRSGSRTPASGGAR